jgi:hypothetical protein
VAPREERRGDSRSGRRRAADVQPAPAGRRAQTVRDPV